jgi:hypothetical protein
MKEMVIFSGAIVGDGKRVECKVRAVKITLDGAPDVPPAFSEYRVLDSDMTDKLPDGNSYEIHLSNGERIPVRRSAGQFLGRL